MALGVRATAEAAVRAGITHIQFAVRPEEDAVAIDAYLKSLQPVPSPHWSDGNAERRRPSAARSCSMSEGRLRHVSSGAAVHRPAVVQRRQHRARMTRRRSFDTPTLIEVWRTAPYMHDGHYTELKKVFTEGKHGAKGGDVQSLTDEQLNDLVEFVLSL